MDAWNYINRECLDGWKRGNSYELTTCEPEEISCPSYASNPDKYGLYENITWSLPEAGMCTITIDATEGVARLIFEDYDYGYG